MPHNHLTSRALGLLAALLLVLAAYSRPSFGDNVDVLLLVNGAVKMCIWAGGAALAFWRKRWMLVAGFGGAALIVAVRAVDDATMPHAAISVVAYAATPIAGLIVASFIDKQPVGAPRPARWTP